MASGMHASKRLGFNVIHGCLKWRKAKAEPSRADPSQVIRVRAQGCIGSARFFPGPTSCAMVFEVDRKTGLEGNGASPIFVVRTLSYLCRELIDLLSQTEEISKLGGFATALRQLKPVAHSGKNKYLGRYRPDIFIGKECSESNSKCETETCV